MEMRCGCSVEGMAGSRVVTPCQTHLEWMKALVRAEREECARLADLQAALDRRRAADFDRATEKDRRLEDEKLLDAYEDFAVTAESIAKAIRFRSDLEAK